MKPSPTLENIMKEMLYRKLQGHIGKTVTGPLLETMCEEVLKLHFEIFEGRETVTYVPSAERNRTGKGKKSP